MMSAWWWMWMVFMFLVLLPPVSYGWGYRGWGPPYPRYIQRRRSQQAAVARSTGTFDHHSWGWRGDLVWVGLLFALLWFCFIFWWR